MQIDAHQHFWIYDPNEYSWITDEKDVLRRNYLPAELAQEQNKLQFDGSIAVQARQTLEESHWLLELAEQDDRIKGVVGWVDLRSARVEDQLRRLADHRKFVGVRHVVQDEPDDRFLLRADFLRGLTKLKDFGLAYDLLIFPKQIPAAIELARRFPEQRFVLDHLAKPFIKDAILAPWSDQIRELASAPNVWCKISGLVTEAQWKTWKPDDFSPYLDVVCEAFGEDRLMVGSDWPVCLLSAEYEEVMALVGDYFGGHREDRRKKIFGENALKCYGIEPVGLDAEDP
ncbi:MAG: amidohydrolase family protein [Verrucomicrobia bacterium]|nr:amidohydrolase family protein [Verrucomicrobiota bacterium]